MALSTCATSDVALETDVLRGATVEMAWFASVVAIVTNGATAAEAVSDCVISVAALPSATTTACSRVSVFAYAAGRKAKQIDNKIPTNPDLISNFLILFSC